VQVLQFDGSTYPATYRSQQRCQVRALW